MISVLIERHIAESLVEHYETNARNIILQAVQTPGFVSGESFQEVGNPNKRIIWSKWHSILNWKAWHNSELRHEMMTTINPTLEEEEKITILENA